MMRTGIYLPCVLLVVLLHACASVDINTFIAERQPITKSENDNREYRYLRLTNGLRLVLISDVDTERAGVSLSVFRGNFSDPEAYQGLAHFLEHMLFIATEKYPEVDGYFNFIESHGGFSNAYTDNDHTNYYFDIQPAFLSEGLDRFIHFFVDPKLEPKYVEREINAVDSEYQLFRKEDGWRAQMVRSMAMNPAHPVRKFSIGSLDTLRDAHAALVGFFDSQYSANQMGLVVLHNQTLDEMESWMVPMAMQIKDRQLRAYEVTESLFEKLPSVLTHQTLQENNSVRFSFPVPLLDPHYKTKPGDYIANLIGHEAKGSLHSALTERGWITWLSAATRHTDDKTSLFVVNIGLTDQGKSRIPEITDLLFDYIALLRVEEPKRWRFEEQAIVSNLGFRFQEEDAPIATVSGISPDLATYPAEDLLIYPYMMTRFDAALIKFYTGLLTPENVLVEVVGPDVATTHTEPWFQVNYKLEQGPIPMRNANADALQLPAPNRFLPEVLTVVPDDTLPPRVISKEASQEIWFDVDTQFGTPRSTLSLSLRNPDGIISLQDVVLAGLYRRLVTDDLSMSSYPALLAGVAYQLATPPKGFRVAVFGYSDKQLILLDTVLDSLMNMDINPDRFNVLKANYLRQLHNSKSDPPYAQTLSTMEDMLLNYSWPAKTQAEYLATVTLDDLDLWRTEQFSRLDVLAMLHGNVTPDMLDELHKVLTAHVSAVDISPVQPVVAEVNGVYEIQVDHEDSAILLRIQDPDDSFASRAKSALMTHLMNNAFFSSLRTEQQLGYVVQMLEGTLHNRGGIMFQIQSPVAPADVLEQRIISFVDERIRVVSGYSNADFKQHKASLISLLTESDKNLVERSRRYWNNLDQGVLTFDAGQQIADELAKLTIADMLAYVKEIRRDLQNRRILVFSRGGFDTKPANAKLLN